MFLDTGISDPIHFCPMREDDREIFKRDIEENFLCLRVYDPLRMCTTRVIVLHDGYES